MSCIEGSGNRIEAYWSNTITNTFSLGLAGGVLSTASVMLRDLAKSTLDEKWAGFFITATPVPAAEKISYVAVKALLCAAGGALTSTLNWNACSTSHPLKSITFESTTVGLQAAVLGAFFLLSLKGTLNQSHWLAYVRTPSPENLHVRNTMIKIVTLVSAAVAVANAAERVISLFGFPVQ